MSTVRQAIAALWAAVWVRWRLLAVRVGRLRGDGDPAAATDSGHYLSPAEIPVEGVDYELVDLPPELAMRLDAARGDLIDHARTAAATRSRRGRVRRRRTASLAAAAVVSLGVLGAGANALVSGSTGVPAVDRLLGIYETGLEKPGAEGRQAPGARQIGPSSTGESTTVRIPLGGGQSVVRTSYVSRGGLICTTTTTEPERGPLAAINCLEPADLERDLASGRSPVGANLLHDDVVLTGFVDGQVVDLAASRPSGAFDVRVGKVWAPEGVRIRPVRVFVAVVARPLRKDGTPTDIDPLDFEFEGVTADGRRVRVRP